MAKSVKSKKSVREIEEDIVGNLPTYEADVKAFFNSYLSSPNYKKRLVGMDYDRPEDAISLRRANMEVTNSKKYYGKPTQYEPTSQKVLMNPIDFYQNPDLDIQSTLAHEYGHVVGGLLPGTPKIPAPMHMNTKEHDAMWYRNKYASYTPKQWSKLSAEKQFDLSHDMYPSEVKADLDTIRYNLYKDKIYDTGTQTFDKATLKKAREKYGSGMIMKRLIDAYSDEDLIWMMNNIAKNDSNGDQSLAENGKYMKVRPKQFTYEALPCIDCKEGLMADMGMSMDPGPRIPGLKNTLADLYPPGEFGPNLDRGVRQVQGPMPIGTPPDTSKVKPGDFINPYDYQQSQKNNFNWGNAALLGLSAFDAILPNRVPRQTVVQPQQAYNPMPYGYGSQAIMQDGGYIMGEDEGNTPSAKDGHWIQKAINPAHKGYCTPMTKSTCTPKRKALAKTLKKMAKDRKKDEGGFIAPGWDKYKKGGIIPDNMSVFNPHMYEHGGNVNGGAKIREVGPNYPNTDLMEQWLLYQNGGDVNGGAKIKEVGANYPNSDLLEQWLLYANGGPIERYLSPSTVKDSEGRINRPSKNKGWTSRPKFSGEQLRRDNMMPTLDYSDASFNIPEPGYDPRQIDYRSAYSASFPEGASQRTAYFPDGETWNSFVNNNSALLIDSQQRPGRGSATLKNRPMKNGGNVNGGAKIKDVGAMFPNADMLEQWLLYRHGGAVPKAQAGMMAFTEDPTKPNKGKAKDPVPKGTPATQPLNRSNIPVGANFNWDSRRLLSGTIDQDARIADRIQEFLGNAYTTRTGAGRATLSSLSSDVDPQFIDDLTTRLTLQQGTPGYGTMTPEQRIQSFYNTPSSGNSTLNQFINRTKTLGGSPSAYWQNNASNLNRPIPTITFRQGGIMYDDGGTLDTMWGGTAELESYNPYDGGTVEFNGPSHERGGIGMNYNGNPVEVEGGEYASKDAEGNLHIYGNMFIPGTKTKFKKAAGAIANKEKRYDFLKTKGSDLVNNANPANRFDQLKFNAGRVMMDGGEMGQKDLASKKDKLANLQKQMLTMATENGLDPFEMSKGKMKKAKGGASIPFMANGGSDPGGNDPTRADRNMNPGNIKYGSFAKKYGAKRDKDGFAIFPDRKTGEKAMRDLLTGKAYNNMSVSQAISKWTENQPYRYDLGPLTDKTVKDLNEEELSIVLNTMKQGEGTRYGLAPRPAPNPRPNTTTPGISTVPFRPYTIPDVPLATPQTPYDPLDPVPPYDQLEDVPDVKIPSNVEPLALNNVLGEIYGAATNRVEPVPAQRYEPQLFTPYQVSFQDRLNANQSVFNAQSRAVGAGNPAALGTLGAQKYQADQAVYADEFRTNQAIANDITNKNIALVNDANLKNLGIADTQMVRQSQARSKTREFNQMILNSLSDKYAKNDLENKRLAAYENLYDYRFVPTEDGGQRATYFGPNAMFNYDGRNTLGNKAQDVRTISRYDAAGNLKGYNEYDESDIKEQQRLLDMEIKRRRMPLMPLQALDR